MRSYETARGLHGLLEFIFWSAVVVGILIAIAGGQSASRSFGGSGLVAVVPGLLISFMSLIGVAQVQNARAAVDSAEYGQQMLDIARRQLEVSQLMLRSQDAAKQSFAQLVHPGSDDGKDTKKSESSPSKNAASYRAETRTSTNHLDNRAKALGNDPKVIAGIKNGEITIDGNTIKVTNGMFYHRGFAYTSLGALEGKLVPAKPLPGAKQSPAKPAVQLPPEQVEPENDTDVSAGTKDGTLKLEYLGYKILENNGSYSMNGINFSSVERAKKYINQLKPLDK